MPLLKHLTPTKEQAQAVYAYKQACRALRDATIVHTNQTAPNHKWNHWFECAEDVRESGLDPLEYSNVKRG